MVTLLKKKIKNSAKSDMYMYVHIRNSNRKLFFKKKKQVIPHNIS